jgi:S1-C subfamily serine protease
MRSPAFISNRQAVLAVAVYTFLPLAGIRAASLMETMDSEVLSLYEKSKDAIVRVIAQDAPVFGAPFRPRLQVGTGFFIDGGGRFVTAATLVEGARNCWIEWRGQRINARLIGTDPNTNLALLQIDVAKHPGEGNPTPCLVSGNSDDLRVGSMVVTVGFPYELPSAPAVGFVTGFDIKCGTRVFPVSYVRASCRLRQGQGGGPMFNARGEVVGIAVAVSSDDQCYGVPISAVQKVCADMMQYGEPQHGYVGLSVTERVVTNAAAQPELQVLVQEVASNSPAADAGFRVHDILLRICTNEIRRSADVLNKVFYLRCHETIKVTVLRNSVTQEVAVVCGHRPASEPLTARVIPQQQLPALQIAGPTIVPVSDQRP